MRDISHMISGEELRERFGLRTGQLRPENRGTRNYTNKYWVFVQDDGLELCSGFGDINDDDLIRIQENLPEWETIRLYNEHHGSDWQQLDHPQIIVTHDDILFQEEIKKLWKEA